MFPIGDDRVHGASRGWVTYLLMLINIIVFLYQVSLSEPALQDFVFRWGVIPTQILNGENWLNLLTSMFMHGGWMHLIGNMLFLWVFGDNVEAVMGHFFYLVFYLLGGIAASLAHVFLNASSAIPSLGASGAIAAVLGSYIVMFPQARIKVFVFLGFLATVTRVAALLFLGIWFVTQLFSGFASLDVTTAQTSGVAFWAHIGGFVFGLIVGFLMRGQAQTKRLIQM